MRVVKVLGDSAESTNWFRTNTAANSAYTIMTWRMRVEKANVVVNIAKIVRGIETRNNMGERRREIKLAMMVRWG